MPRNLPLLSLAAALLVATGPLQAQAPSTIDPAALDAAVTEVSGDARTVVSEALTTDRATAVARTMGLDPVDLEARINALDDATAERLADRILAGGSSITISVTAIIIILLLLILIAD